MSMRFQHDIVNASLYPGPLEGKKIRVDFTTEAGRQFEEIYGDLRQMKANEVFVVVRDYPATPETPGRIVVFRDAEGRESASIASRFYTTLGAFQCE